jgi:hypothetical protein
MINRNIRSALVAGAGGSRFAAEGEQALVFGIKPANVEGA